MIKPLLSLKRLSIDEAKGKVCYQYGNDSSEFEYMDYPPPQRLQQELLIISLLPIYLGFGA